MYGLYLMGILSLLIVFDVLQPCARIFYIHYRLWRRRHNVRRTRATKAATVKRREPSA